MSKIVEAIKNNPVRIYTVTIAVVALVARYVADFPTDLVLGLIAAVLGIGGEVTRAAVTPNRKL